MKKYRYRKVTPEVLKGMKKLRKEGLSYRKIAKELNISSSSIIYHLNPKEREKCIERALKTYYKLTKEQKRGKERKRYAYKKQYYLERYKEDEKFRKSQITLITKSFNRRQKVWEIAGLCNRCGRKKIEKKWRRCENCREKKRKEKEVK